jgi:glycosyltransferase involved in cell wall biosynthesis
MADNRRRLQVLMTADTLGGVWDYSLELARQLASYGIDTVLATMGRLPSVHQRQAAAAIPSLQLQSSQFKLEWMPDAGEEPLQAGEWLLELEKRHAPDIVHLNGYVHGTLPWRAPTLLVAHSCVLSWWQAVKGGAAPPEWQSYAERVRSGLRQATMVVAPTGAMLATLQGLYGPLMQAEIVWNGRNPMNYRPDRKEDHLFTAGRFWDEGKNLTALCAIAGDLDWPIFAAGDWRHPDGSGECPRQVNCLGILTAEEMREQLGRAAIYVLPARYEPFGLSILEAALCGCALVLGDIPSLRELWDGAAVFVPTDDHDRLRSTLRALCGQPEWRLALGCSARVRGLRYGSDRMTAAYIDLYRDLLHLRPVAGNSYRHAQPAKI